MNEEFLVPSYSKLRAPTITMNTTFPMSSPIKNLLLDKITTSTINLTIPSILPFGSASIMITTVRTVSWNSFLKNYNKSVENSWKFLPAT